MFNKTYELPLSRSYVKHWGVAEAVRELLQNALDSDSPLEWRFGEDDSLTITSRNARLEPRSLLLGSTSKSDASDKIGQFGEGYKIALLVLTREGREVTIFNNDLIWGPVFKHSKTFNEEVLVIEEQKYPEGRGKGLQFVIEGLTADDIAQIKARTLHMQESIGEVEDTSFGQILLDQPGKLYVKGLYVCDTKLWFGYNVKPEFLKLERDRQTVDSFDLEWLAKQMWFEAKGRMPQVVELLEKECPDLKYANYDCPEVLKEACYQHFRKQNPDAVVAVNNDQLQEAVRAGMTVYSHTGALGHILQEVEEFNPPKPVPKAAPVEVLRTWLRANRGDMRTGAIVSFKQLINDAEGWKP